MNKYKIIIFVLLLVILGLVAKDYFIKNKSIISPNISQEEKTENAINEENKKEVVVNEDSIKSLNTNFKGLFIRGFTDRWEDLQRIQTYKISYEQDYSNKEILLYDFGGLGENFNSLRSKFSLIKKPKKDDQFQIYIGGDNVTSFYDETTRKFSEGVETFKNNYGVIYHRDGGGDSCGAGGSYYVEIPNSDVWITFPWYTRNPEEPCGDGKDDIENKKNEKIIKDFLDNVHFGAV